MTTTEQTLLTPAQAARSLGLSESTVRRLCDQGALESLRTDGGHRRIRPTEVAAYARRAARPLNAEQARGAAGQGGRRASEHELVRRTTQALLAGDGRLLRRLLSELSLSGESAAYVADRVLTPALAELGERWCQGQLSVYREHRASELVLSYLAQAREAHGVAARARRALCAAPEGDPNSLASAMAAWVLSESGYAAVMLGANMPFDALYEALAELRPQLLVLSVSHVADLKTCAARCSELSRHAAKNGCALALGGRALTPEVRHALKADFVGDSLSALRDYAEQGKTRGR
ncbi:MAG: binding domain protein excisionase family [Myxococcaceae bacterium]|nr:binding domain protein excisionase family [Myxococcaceae bacterium]